MPANLKMSRSRGSNSCDLLHGSDSPLSLLCGSWSEEQLGRVPFDESVCNGQAENLPKVEPEMSDNTERQIGRRLSIQQILQSNTPATSELQAPETPRFASSRFAVPAWQLETL